MYKPMQQAAEDALRRATASPVPHQPVGPALRTAREAVGVTTRELADRRCLAMPSVQERLERRRDAKWSMLEDVARALGLIAVLELRRDDGSVVARITSEVRDDE